MGKRLTTSQWIEKAKQVHGDKYNYSESEYIRAKDKISILCATHGLFRQTASSHLAGCGCPKCGTNSMAEKQSLTTSGFVQKASKIHNDKYDYRLSEYKNNHTKVLIVCPEHGEFVQSPADHLQGKGCLLCGKNTIATKLTSSTDEWIVKAKAAHQDRYDYTKTNYIKATIPVTIECPIHGEFEQMPSNHLQGQGCSKCSEFQRIVKSTKTTNEFIEQAKIIHGDKYEYSLVEYCKARNKVTIICPTHGPFEQNANSHLQGCGCPGCVTNGGFSTSKPAYSYYLKVVTADNILYKIGVTNRTVEARFSLQDLNKIEIIKLKLHKTGKSALKWEKYFLNKYSEYRYTGAPVLKDGNTELFTADILLMEKSSD